MTVDTKEVRDCAERVVRCLKRMPPEEQLERVAKWLEQALKIRCAVKKRERDVMNRKSIRRAREISESHAEALAAEALLAEARKSDAGEEWYQSHVGEHFRRHAAPIVVALAAIWHVEHKTVMLALAGEEPWPISHAQHIIVGQGIRDIASGKKSLSAPRVAILSLVMLNHKRARISRKLRVDAGQIRRAVRGE